MTTSSCGTSRFMIQPTTPVLKYSNLSAPAPLRCDASMNDLGACPMQGGRPVAYEARSLTVREDRYDQVERGLLAITVRMENSKPTVMEAIFKKGPPQHPKRLQWMHLRL